MRTLRDTIGLIVASVAAGSCGDSGSSDAKQPECPHTVVLRTFDVSLTGSEACQLISGPTYHLFAQGTQGGDPAVCASLCKDAKINSCRLPLDYESRYQSETIEAGTPDPDAGTAAVCTSWTSPATALLSCNETEARGTWHQGCPVEGRRPAGLCCARVADDASVLGRWFATTGHLEAAAVIAFSALASELRERGAPAELLEKLAVAEREERRHVELTSALAQRFGAEVPAVQALAPAPRSLEDLAHENVVEGVVRETFGAALAAFRATRAADPGVRQALAEIAADELRHAELGFELDAWLRSKLSVEARARLDATLWRAVRELGAEAVGEPHPLLRRVAGLPSERECRALLDGLERQLWAERAAA